ncbi:MAG: hypothetical protein LBO78_02645 [Rickettsiales bacterium]|jgi:hypothetical protein|nr:hypothetical protein [Rickettsiales bacterium]
MKLFLNGIALVAGLLILSQPAPAQRGNTRKLPTASTPKKTTAAAKTVDIKEDCATKYIAALDKECYNSATALAGGVYADCSDKTIPEYYDVMDMQLARVVDGAKFREYLTNCAQYKGYALEKWLNAKGIIETSAVKSSPECVSSKDRLAMAKQCYTAAMAHDGNFFEFGSLMQRTCGRYPDVAEKFSKAGDVTLASIPKMLQNYSSLQFTNKSENWRSAIEATLVGYIYDAQSACGGDIAEIIMMNQFAPEERENLLTIAQAGFADQFGGNLGARTNHYVRHGNPSAWADPHASAVKNVMGYGSDNMYKSLGWKDAVKDSDAKRAHKKIDLGKTAQGTGPSSVNNVYSIDDVPNINTARARLSSIISTGDVGTAGSRDELDMRIISSLGGRANAQDTGIYNIISALEDNDMFVIKQAAGGLCQVLRLKDGKLSKLSNREVDGIPAIYDYLYGCNDLAE